MYLLALCTKMQNTIWIRAAKITAIDYFKNTSLTGFKLLFCLNNNLLQIIWVPFLLTGLVAAVYITGHCILFFQLNPTVTYINTFQQPIGDVPFPAVSICSVNKISDQAMREYVSYIYKTTWNLGMDEAALLKKFDLFGGFYDNSGFDIDEAYELQIFLEKRHSLNQNFFNATHILGKLAPKCEDLLRKCSWAGKVFPCAELFIRVPTAEGFCCIFNYNKPKKQSETLVKHLEFSGRDLGLKILLNTSTEDYFFTKRSTTGFIVQIFNSLFFPDILTGRVSEFPVSPNTDVLATLTITSLSTEEEVRDYKIGQRRCYFADELPKIYGAHYNQPECNLRCKLQSIQSLCNCIPYYTPQDFIDWDPPILYCTLSHLECLSRYKTTWTSYRPTKKTTGLEQEMEVALNCRQCLPLCNTDEYEYQLDKSTFYADSEDDDDKFLSDETDLNDVSLLRIYFATPFSLQYKKRLIYTANGLFANVGGILGISIGCSLISIIEIFYFATVKYYINLKRLRSIAALEQADEENRKRHGN